MGMNLPEAKRPALRTLLGPIIFTGWLAAYLVLDKVFHQAVIAFAALFLIALGYVAWYFLRYWHSMGWLSLPKRNKS